MNIKQKEYLILTNFVLYGVDVFFFIPVLWFYLIGRGNEEWYSDLRGYKLKKYI